MIEKEMFIKNGAVIRADDVYLDPRDATIEAQAAEIEHLKDVYSSATECFLEAQEEIERLRKAGTKLAGYAGHDDNCEIMLKGVWSDPIPCTCGYEDAWKAWAALGDTE
jgi:hypothetical protein